MKRELKVKTSDNMSVVVLLFQSKCSNWKNDLFVLPLVEAIFVDIVFLVNITFKNIVDKPI